MDIFTAYLSEVRQSSYNMIKLHVAMLCVRSFCAAWGYLEAQVGQPAVSEVSATTRVPMCVRMHWSTRRSVTSSIA